MKKTALIIVLALLLIVVAVVFAAGTDDKGNPNDPATNERANACYEGGSLAGKCGNTDVNHDGQVEDWEVEWMWTCGWYLIRYEHGAYGRNDVPFTCRVLLPQPNAAAPGPTEAPPTSTPEVTPEPDSVPA